MDNAANIFYALVIVASTIVSVWAIVTMIQTSPTLQERRKNRHLAEIVKQHELSRKQSTLVAVAATQKAHYSNH